MSTIGSFLTAAHSRYNIMVDCSVRNNTLRGNIFSDSRQTLVNIYQSLCTYRAFTPFCYNGRDQVVALYLRVLRMIMVGSGFFTWANE